jgi:hypothetical protein
VVCRYGMCTSVVLQHSLGTLRTPAEWISCGDSETRRPLFVVFVIESARENNKDEIDNDNERSQNPVRAALRSCTGRLLDTRVLPG